MGSLKVHVVLAMVLAVSSGVARAELGQANEYVGVIKNDVVWQDVAGEEIWANGGNMVKVGDVFYWIGCELGSGRRTRMNLYSSKNLADWKFENSVVKKEGDFAKFGWAGRPALVHCEKTGKWVIVFEAAGRGWFRHKVGYAVCDRIDGDYELAACEYPEERQSTGDQSVYQEGQDAYLLAVLDGQMGQREQVNDSLAIYRLRNDYLGVDEKVYQGWHVTERILDDWVGDRQGIGCEAPHIIKRKGVYYMFTSRLWGWHSSPTMYSTASRLKGPWSDLKLLKTYWEGWARPTLSFNTQHDFVIPIKGSDATAWLYVGDRYSQFHHYGTGRNIFLPIEWVEGEPILRWRQQWRIDTQKGTWQNIGEFEL